MNFLKSISPHVHWLPRIALASVFLYHGLGKFPVAAGMAQMMGMPVIMIYMLAMVEVIGSLLILYGGFGPDWATRLGGLFFTPVMLGAIFMVHIKNGWNSINMGTGNMGMGMEFQFVLLCISLFFLIRGNDVKAVA